MDPTVENVDANAEVKKSKSQEKKEKKRLAALAKKNEKSKNKPQTTKKVSEEDLDPSVWRI